MIAEIIVATTDEWSFWVCWEVLDPHHVSTFVDHHGHLDQGSPNDPPAPSVSCQYHGGVLEITTSSTDISRERAEGLAEGVVFCRLMAGRTWAER